MGKTSYDDWNFANGEVISSGSGSFSGYKGSKSSLVFLFTVIILTIINLVNTYSAGLGLEEVSSNRAYYLVRQFVFIAVGCVASLFVSKLPSSVIKPVSALLVLFCIFALAVNTFLDIAFLTSQAFMHFVFGSSILYWSSFFSNRDNRVETLKDMSVPAVFTVILMFFVLTNAGSGYAISYILMTVILFLLFGVRFFTVILIVLYALLPISIYILKDVSKIKTILDFIVPGLYSKTSGSATIAAKSAIASGSFFGQGLGNGQFKFILGNDIIGKYSFCNFAEELGFVGVLFLFGLSFVFIFSGYLKSENCKDLFDRDCALGFCSLFAFQVLCNLGYILGIIPFDRISFPFLSAGPEIITLMLESSFILRYLKGEGSEEKSQTEQTKAVTNETSLR